jgi:hypothetical protein
MSHLQDSLRFVKSVRSLSLLRILEGNIAENAKSPDQVAEEGKLN